MVVSSYLFLERFEAYKRLYLKIRKDGERQAQIAKTTQLQVKLVHKMDTTGAKRETSRYTIHSAHEVKTYWKTNIFGIGQKLSP